jgi:hypothetical protein
VLSHGYGWLFDLLWQATGLELDEDQLQQIADASRRKLIDLFDVAEETALANGRELIRWHDLPLTLGLRRTILETETLARQLEVDPARAFAGEARVNRAIDEIVRAGLPRLTTALLVLSSRLMATLEPIDIPPEERCRLVTRSDPNRPTTWELERAERVLDQTL